MTPCLAAGIWLRHVAGECDINCLWLGAIALAGAAALALHRRRDSCALACGLCAITAAGAILADQDQFPARRNTALAAFERGEISAGVPGRFDVCLEDEPLKYPEETVVTASLRAFESGGRWFPAAGRVLVRIGHGGAEETEGAGIPLQAGDRARGWVQWSLPRNFENPGAQDRVSFLRRRGIDLLARVKSPRLLETIPGDCASAGDRLVQRLRHAATRVFETLAASGRREAAAVLASVVVGDYSNLGRDAREAFQNSGTYHVLVVSGLHVAWIAAVLVSILHWLRAPVPAARAAVAVTLVVYSAVVGWQASISRALWMFLLHLLGGALFRDALPTNVALASAFCLLAVNPAWLFDAGFQLSFLAVLAICLTAVPITRDFVGPALIPATQCGQAQLVGAKTGTFHALGRTVRFRIELAVEALSDHLGALPEETGMRVCRAVARIALAAAASVVVSVSVQSWLEPVLALYFNRLSWIAPVANLVLVPLSSVVLAAGVAAALTGGVPAVAPATAAFAAWTAEVLLNAAGRISAIPRAWQRCPTPSFPIVLVLTLLVFATWFLRSRWRFPLFAATAAILAVLGTGVTAPWMIPGLGSANPAWAGLGGRQPRLSLTFLDVGQGDSAAVSFPDGRLWMVDAGGIREAPGRAESAPGFDVGESVVSPYLWWLWVGEVDRLVLTHSHQDHAGGMPALLRNFAPARFDFASSGRDPELSGVLSKALEKNVLVKAVSSGHEWRVGDVRVSVLHPPAGGRTRSPNDCSVVLLVEYGRFRALLTGDIERTSEAEILARAWDLSANLLKVAHHGGRSSSLDGFLEEVRPRWGVISAGRNNPFGHPARETVTRLLRHGIQPVLTMDQGAVHFETDGENFTLESHRLGLLAEGSLPARRPGR